MATDRVLPPASRETDGRIKFFGTFASPTVESAYRRSHLRDHLWLIRFLAGAAALRVSALVLADFQDFGTGPDLWPLLATRVAFLLISVALVFAVRRVTCAWTADRLFFAWSAILAAVTVYSLSARPPGNYGFLLMSFAVVLVVYLVAPLPFSRQLILALSFSAAALYLCRGADDGTAWNVVTAYALSNVFGAVTSWQLNRRRREAFLGTLREAELREGLEAAMAEIKTLRGMLCICAWCKRIRDEADEWESVETYVQNHTHAAFTHGMCPDCLRSEVGKLAESHR